MSGPDNAVRGQVAGYHLVVDEIAEAFLEAPLIFLWRNPLAVVASAVELFDGGHFEAPRYTMALFQSFQDLVAAPVDTRIDPSRFVSKIWSQAMRRSGRSCCRSSASSSTARRSAASPTSSCVAARAIPSPVGAGSTPPERTRGAKR